jgi:cytochrome c biogenesis protein CcdA
MMTSDPSPSTPGSLGRRLGLIIGVVCAILGLGFGFLGFAMAGSFTVANPAELEHWQRVAAGYAALAVGCLLFLVTVAVRFVRRWRKSAA